VAEPFAAGKRFGEKCPIMPPVMALALRDEGYRVLGLDLTTIPGMSVLHVQAVVAEVGPDLSKFRSAATFSSWMGLCPDKAVCMGKILWTGTRRENDRTTIGSKS